MAKRLIAVISLWLMTDFYFYRTIETVFGEQFSVYYWLIDAALIVTVIATLFIKRGSKLQQIVLSWVMGITLLSFIPRLAAMPLLMAEDLTRVIRGFPPHAVWVARLSIIIATAVFGVVLFGITRGRHFYKVRKETIAFPDLPEAFNGFTITQITDVHSGSFTSLAGVQKGLDLINAQRSDVILFTGDLVNNKASEMEPWIAGFAGLNAPMGKYSVLGNHDYGDYIQWESKEAKAANLARLKEIHSEMGFRLLLDESVKLKKDGAEIALLGVENWGKGGFHKYGDLSKASRTITDDIFKILLSHDPSHWEGVTLQHSLHVHLTLSGHTHGMQFGIDFWGIKWSPVQYVYKQWAGLYERAGRYLYVNRGFGFLGLKGRIGMWPEVAVIKLTRST